uniref:adhesion G protein-coupled receptor E1-like isoform X3 n=1 Tax=Myxine glutinosa TaxID=7769 RepID=UPI00358FEC71
MKRLGMLVLHVLLFLLEGNSRFTGSACPQCHPLAKCQPPGWCVCADGFVGNGVMFCFDVDECIQKPCKLQHEICHNTPGSYNCSCKPGFARSSTHCEDIDECAAKMCKSENEICHNTAGSYECSCKHGFVRLSSNCEKVYTTTSTTNTTEYVSASTPAASAAESSFNTSSYKGNETANDYALHCAKHAKRKGGRCVCNRGYAGNGQRCMDRNECDTSLSTGNNTICEVNADCVNTDGDFYCECKEGYQHAHKKSTFKHSTNSCILESVYFPPASKHHPKEKDEDDSTPDVDAGICKLGQVCGICRQEEGTRSEPRKICKQGHRNRQGLSKCQCKTALNWTSLDFTKCVKKGGVPKGKVLETFSELDDAKELASPAALCGLMLMLRRSSGAVRDKGPFHTQEGHKTLRNVGKGISLIMKSKSSWKGFTKSEIKHRMGNMYGYTEDILMSIADGLSIPSKLELNTTEVEMSVNVINTSSADAESMTFGKPGLGSVAISKSMLKEHSKNGLARVVTALYRNISQIQNGVRSRLVSPVISVTVGDSSNTFKFKKNITYTLQIVPTGKKEKAACVFWDLETDAWSTDGCTVLSQNSSEVTCSCNHLTNFAVLMARTELSEAHIWKLGIVSRVGLLVSLACLLPAGFTFAFCRALRSPRNTVHMNLCLCLFVAELCFILGIQRRENKILCAVIAGALHYTFLAAFSWMFLEGVCLYAMVVRIFPGMDLRTRSLLLAGYGLPAIVITLSASIYPNGYGSKMVNGQIFCWLDENLKWGFFGPAAIILLIYCPIISLLRIILVLSSTLLLHLYLTIHQCIHYLNQAIKMVESIFSQCTKVVCF